MSATAGRVVSKVSQAATRAAGKAAEAGASDKKSGVLQKGAKRDPELYVCCQFRLRHDNEIISDYKYRFCLPSCLALSALLVGISVCFVNSSLSPIDRFHV